MVMPRDVVSRRAGMAHHSPVAGEDFIRPPAKKEGVGATVNLVEIVPCFGVDKRDGPDPGCAHRWLGCAL